MLYKKSFKWLPKLETCSIGDLFKLAVSNPRHDVNDEQASAGTRAISTLCCIGNIALLVTKQNRLEGLMVCGQRC